MAAGAKGFEQQADPGKATRIFASVFCGTLRFSFIILKTLNHWKRVVLSWCLSMRFRQKNCRKLMLSILAGIPRNECDSPVRKQLVQGIGQGCGRSGTADLCRMRGLMFLGEAIVLDGTAYPMAGVFPLTFSMHKRPRRMGILLRLLTAESFLSRRHAASGA